MVTCLSKNSIYSILNTVRKEGMWKLFFILINLFYLCDAHSSNSEVKNCYNKTVSTCISSSIQYTYFRIISHLNEYRFPTQCGGLRAGEINSFKNNASHNGA
jgi:hypothetical protein